MDRINEFLEANRCEFRISGYTIVENRPRLVCADGFSMSVQASDGHYCTPRENEGPYSKVEVGYPDTEEVTLKPYQDGDSDVYGYVPIEIIDAIVEKHGGLVFTQEAQP